MPEQITPIENLHIVIANQRGRYQGPAILKF